MKTHLDLFSGIGGFAIAARNAGFTTIGFSEIEPYACRILKRHWPEVPNYGDIKNVRGLNADIITGGFPCQPFSVAGKRRGSEDDRHLWPEMCRVIAETRPAWVLGENVPGIINMELDRVLSDLEGIGYACWPIVIPACAVDARHRRDRLWIVAHANRITAWTGRPGRSETGFETSNCGETLANPNETGRGEQCGTEPMGPEHAAVECSGQDVSNSDGWQHESGVTQPNHRTIQGTDEGDWCRWPSESGIRRVANGIPNRSHRLKGLGNAIVPQVAETLLRMMMQNL